MLPIPLSTRLRGFAFRGTVQVAALAAASHAATFNVTKFSDPNGCGLREAIDAINSGIAKAGCPAPDNSSNDIYMLGGTYSATIGLKLSTYANIMCAGPGECNLDAGNFSGPLLTLAGASDPHVYIQKVGFRQLSDNANTVTGISVEAGYVGLEDVSISGFKGTGLAILDGTDNSVLRGRFSNMGSNAVAVGTGAGLRMEYCYISGSSVGVFLSQDATTHIDMSLIEGNTGRGIKSTGEFFLRRSTVRGNKSGGIRVDGGFGNIDYCSIESNSTPGDGGGIAILAGYANVHYSTISENSATGNGGGVYMKTGANLHHTTISTNTADLGGGIYHDPQGAAGSGYAEPAHCTIAFNKAHTRGGGIYRLIGNGSAHTLNGSIVANNSAPTHPDVSGDGKGLLNSSYTLYGDIDGFTGIHYNDFYAASGKYDPYLGPLTYNAGPYRLKTHALLKGSPALDRIEETSGTGITDARGFPRFVPGFWDLGAYEAGPLETELLKVLEQSADEHRVNAENYLSNGLGTILSADAVGDSVVYEVAVAEPGIHDISIRGKGGPSRGIYQAAAFIDGQWKIIGLADLYRSGPGFLTRAVGFLEFKTAGVHRFCLKVAGKNSRSTGYMGYFDYINITKR